MPGTIQSIERAAAMLRLLGSAGRPLALVEVAAPLDLPRPTAHGILRTLREVGFVDQDRDTGRYTLAAGLRRLGSGWDRHDLRSRAMNWADSLAGSAGQEVLLGMPAGSAVELVHHVFRPDGSPQRLRTGEHLPLHATAVGKCLLAYAPIAVPRPHELDLQPYTGRTVVAVGTLTEQLATARQRGWVAELGEHRTGVGGLAAPVRTGGGLVVGALGVEGPVEELFGGGGTPVPRLAEQLLNAAREISAGLGDAPMTERVVAAIDQGTTSTRCLLFNPAGRMVAVAQREHRQHYPRSGWVEHDAEEIWRNVTRIVPAALRSAGLGPENIVALGIANQRETTVIWDRHTGTPLARAITWQDTRTDGILARLVDDGSAARVTERCGLPLATYFAGPRLRWLLDHVPGARAGAVAGDVLFGTMESWLVWRLTGGSTGGTHITDVTNASRTMLMDLQTRAWDPELLKVLDIPERMLPEIRPNSQIYGTCTTVLPGVPVAGALGDQQAALVGQACFAAGEAKCTYGTGAFLLMNTGPRIARSTHGLIPTVGYVLGDEVRYALEGSIAVTGSLVQWFRDGLGMISTAPQIETLAASVPDNGGCYIVPAFSGLYAPRWHPEARGVMVGLTSYITRGHLARAVLEATGWQTREVVDAMNADSGLPVTRLKVDGGMTANHLLMQFVADVLDVPVERPLGSEAVSLGAAYAAGLAVGYWSDLEILRGNWHRAAAWEPAMDPEVRRQERENWSRAVDRSYGWAPAPTPE